MPPAEKELTTVGDNTALWYSDNNGVLQKIVHGKNLCTKHETNHKDATCTEDGWVKYECTYESDRYATAPEHIDEWTETIPALGHDWKDNGDANHICDRDHVTAAHTYGEWEIVKDATETTCGTARHYCQVCGEAETVHTAKLTPYSKQGRITKDLTPVYNSESGNTVVMYLAKGVTFEFANVKYGSRYKVSAFKDVYGKTSASGEYYVAIDSVEVDPGTVPVYTAYTGLQKIVTVTTDGRLNVRSGHSDTSAVVSSVAKGETLYIYEVQGNWGRISATENKWVQTVAGEVSSIPVFGCGDQQSLSTPDAPAKELADVGTVTAQVSTIVRDSGNKSVQSAQGHKDQFLLYQGH